jgi:hypothetical protein
MNSGLGLHARFDLLVISGLHHLFVRVNCIPVPTLVFNFFRSVCKSTISPVMLTYIIFGCPHFVDVVSCPANVAETIFVLHLLISATFLVNTRALPPHLSLFFCDMFLCQTKFVSRNAMQFL